MGPGQIAKFVNFRRSALSDFFISNSLKLRTDKTIKL